jgi:hypothetical protein
LPTEPLGQPLPYQARSDVGPTARSSADDDAHRPRRIGLRLCDARHGRERDRTRRQMQEFATRVSI